MLPNHVLSDTPIVGDYLAGDNIKNTLLHDFELGGIALNDPSQGLEVQVWECYYDGNNIIVNAPSLVNPITILTIPGVTELAFCFDQNMRPMVAYVVNKVVHFWWFDEFVGHAVFSTVAGASSPRVCMDDKRKKESGTSDMILAYVRSNNLYFRAQRDRFGTEYLLKTGLNGKLLRIGMNNKLRVQFKVQPNV